MAGRLICVPGLFRAVSTVVFAFCALFFIKGFTKKCEVSAG